MRGCTAKTVSPVKNGAGSPYNPDVPKPRVLLVLDDAKLALHVQGFLGGHGFESTIAKNGAETMDLMGKSPRPDAVVASQLLPGMDGVTLAQKIKKETSVTKVMLLAAVGSPAAIQDVRKTSGAEQVLGRGFKPEQLLKELQRMLGLLPPRNASSGKGAAAAARSAGVNPAPAARVDAGDLPDAEPLEMSDLSEVSELGKRAGHAGASRGRSIGVGEIELDLGDTGGDLELGGAGTGGDVEMGMGGGFAEIGDIGELEELTPVEPGIVVSPPPPAAATAAIEEALKWAVAPTGPSAPVAPAPESPAKIAVPETPFEPAWMLSRAFADNVSGALRLVSGGVERTLYLDQGRPIVATSNVPEERIGAILVAKGKLSDKGLHQLLDTSKKTGRRLAELVVQSGAITEAERFSIVAEQYAERILAVFSWRNAGIEFQPRPAPAEEIAVQLPTERLLMEGLRRHYDAARLEACLADPNRVLALLPGADARLPSLALTPLELDTFIFVDGKRTLAQVAEVAPVRLEALRILYGGVCLNLLA